jgi:hypothetical protein
MQSCVWVTLAVWCSQVERAVEEVRLKALRQDLTARTLPGDPTSEVRGGPKRRELDWAVETHMFLARNAKRGADFARRTNPLQKHAAKNSSLSAGK